MSSLARVLSLTLLLAVSSDLVAQTGPQTSTAPLVTFKFVPIASQLVFESMEGVGLIGRPMLSLESYLPNEGDVFLENEIAREEKRMRDSAGLNLDKVLTRRLTVDATASEWRAQDRDQNILVRFPERMVFWGNKAVDGLMEEPEDFFILINRKYGLHRVGGKPVKERKIPPLGSFTDEARRLIRSERWQPVLSEERGREVELLDRVQSMNAHLEKRVEEMSTIAFSPPPSTLADSLADISLAGALDRGVVSINLISGRATVRQPVVLAGVGSAQLIVIGYITQGEPMMGRVNARPVRTPSGARSLYGLQTPVWPFKIKLPPRDAIIDADPVVDFGNVNLGRSATREITIRNLGEKSLEFSSALTRGMQAKYSVTRPPEKNLLAPKEEVVVEVSFSPQMLSDQLDGHIEISSNGGYAKVLLRGAGVDEEAPTISILSPKEFRSFVAGTPLPLKFEVKDNDAIAELSIDLSLDGGNTFVKEIGHASGGASGSRNRLAGQITWNIGESVETERAIIRFTALDASGNVARYLTPPFGIVSD